MKIKVTWQDIEDYINYVYANYKDEKITGVYGIPRGGIILAVLISHKFNIPMLMAPIEDCIIVDDICDSGESLVHYQNNSSGDKKHKYHITTMFYKKNDLVEPELWYKEKENNWIVYPWEED